MRYMINYFFCTFIKQLMSMQGEGSLDSSSLKTFQNKCQVGCFYMLGFVVKRIKFKTNLCFQSSWLLFML